jgi:hypothetical protein
VFDHERLERIERELQGIRERLGQIWGFLLAEEREEHRKHRKRSAVLFFRTSEGDFMDLTAHVNDKPGKAIFTEFDGLSGTGNKVPPVGAVGWTSSDPTVATVDPATGALVYLKAGTATITGTDAGNSLTASAVLTLIASVAVSATVTLQPGA